jgi:hypothetical protein
MNAAVERFHSLDQTLADIKAAHNDEMTELRATLMEAQTRAALAENLLKDALEGKAHAERIAVKFITQFAMVEKIFSEVKTLAMAAQELEPPVREPKTPAEEMAKKLAEEIK